MVCHLSLWCPYDMSILEIPMSFDHCAEFSGPDPHVGDFPLYHGEVPGDD